jgi:acetoacetyl-CoA synthetase
VKAPCWEPSAERIESARLAAYMRRQGFSGYHELWEWSVTDVEGFWASLWEEFAIEASQPYERVLGESGMPGAQWFPGARLSYARHVFRDRDDEATAIVHSSEIRQQAEMSWRELRELTARIANGLRARGVEPGDRVAAYMPNIPETVAAFLACASLGAIWSSCPPEFGTAGVVDRFAQIEPKILLAADGYRYGGKDHTRLDTIAELERQIPSIGQTFVLPYLGEHGNWHELLADGEVDFVDLPFDHPLWVLYSSGTTGLPKAIVHSQGGILLEHLKKHLLHLDLIEGDRLFWFTTTGWMMWNFLVGALLSDAAIVLYDGSPAAPDLGRLWDVAEAAGVTCFGTSAAYISTCMKRRVEPARGRDLSRLRAVGSTGSPLSSDGFDWVYEQLGADVWLFSTSGGTDLCTAFVGGVPTLPVYKGELQARSLGAKVEAFDEHGCSLVGRVGELVITEPMPSMPVGFWGDDGGSRYRAAYFETYPGVWRHGDWIEITTRGTAIISGRSDATINRDGVRIGTAEIYRAVLTSEAVVDALAVDIPREDTAGTIVLFVVLHEDAVLDDALRAELRRVLRSRCSPRHVPDDIHQVPAIPRNLSGKILEVPVKRILLGEPPEAVVSRDLLADPGALDAFVELAAARSGA